MKQTNYFLRFCAPLLLMAFIATSCGDDSDDETSVRAFTECPDNKHPHMIDLGLPSGTKWACCNVGANKPEDYGDYFAWGETKPKEVYSWDTYQYGSIDNLVNIGSDIAGTQYDAATANWSYSLRGTSWRMPTLNQVEELLGKCKSQWITFNGVYGRTFKGTNGSSIFLPAAGRRWNDGLSSVGEWGLYWSSTIYESSLIGAYGLDFDSDGMDRFGNRRDVGFSVRPVRSI